METKVRKTVKGSHVFKKVDASGQTKAIPRKGILRRAIEDFPSQSAQLASLPVVVACMAASGGLSAFRQLGTAISTGDPIGAIALAGVSIYALVAAGSIAQMKEGMRASEHDRAEAAKTGALVEALDQMKAYQAQSQESMIEIKDWLYQFGDRLDRLTHEYIARNSAERLREKNVAQIWANFAPGSTLYVVNGQCRFDIISEVRVDGSIKLVPDYKRLLSWLKRYGPKGIARANVIVFTDDSVGATPTSVTSQVAFYITAFRALKKLAKAYNVPLRLDSVRFFLQKKANARPSYFVGAYAFGEKSMDFVIRYCDYASMFNVPRTMLDDDVEVDYSPAAATKYRHLAETLMAGVPSLSLRDLEKRYGHLVPDDSALDPNFVTRNPILVDAIDHTIDEIITNGDHFVIRRGPRTDK